MEILILNLQHQHWELEMGVELNFNFIHRTSLLQWLSVIGGGVGSAFGGSCHHFKPSQTIGSACAKSP
jgi:hypothetical protein